MLNEMTDVALVAELGRRVAAHRIALRLSQAEFAERAGVSRSTVQRIETGESIQLLSLVKILRALERIDALDALLAPRVRMPLVDLERERGRRRRVRHRAKEGRAPDRDESAPPWSWGDEGDG